MKELVYMIFNGDLFVVEDYDDRYVVQAPVSVGLFLDTNGLSLYHLLEVSECLGEL